MNVREFYINMFILKRIENGRVNFGLNRESKY